MLQVFEILLHFEIKREKRLPNLLPLFKPNMLMDIGQPPPSMKVKIFRFCKVEYFKS